MGQTPCSKCYAMQHKTEKSVPCNRRSGHRCAEPPRPPARARFTQMLRDATRNQAAECNPPPRRNGSREASGGMRFWCCLALACPALIAAVPSAELCRQCHAPEYEAHVRSAHFTAMKPARQSSFEQGLNGLTLRESADGYEFLYKLTAEGIAITAIRGTRRGEGLIEWVIGAGLQGQTPLVRTPQGLRESRVSYYPKLERYGVTFGHPAGVSSSPEAALGIAETKGEAQHCIGCHSSGVTEDLEPGVPRILSSLCS